MPQSGKSRSGTRKSVASASPVPSASSSTQVASQAPAPLIEERLKAHREKREAYIARRNGEILPLKNQGNDLFKSGDYLNARASYLQAMDAYGPHPVLFSNLAAVFLKLEKFSDAEAAATAALYYEPNNLKVRYRRGLARREMHKFRAAISDFTTIIENDPSHHEAAEELERTENLSDFDNEDDDDDYDDVDCSWPYYGSPPLLLLSTGYESDSSDYRHRGNGFPCRFYNHDGCSKRTTCSYSHAPDSKSQRDELGRNVCIYFLIDQCKYGNSKCVYSHDKTYLGKGWWQDEQLLADTRERFQYLDPEEFGDDLECFLHGLTRPPLEFLFEGALLQTAGSAPPHELKPPSERFVLLVEFDTDDYDYKKLTFNAISSRINLVKAFAKEAVGLLSSLHIAGVFLADADITKRKHTRLLEKLVGYVKGGGTVVLGGSFSTFFPLREFDSFFGKIWGVPWQEGSYHRTTFKVNPANELAKKNPSLLSSYSMKALHIKNASENDAIYKPTSQSQVESMVFAADRITNLAESPAVYTRIGKGHLGYVGDVNWEDGSIKVILAMLELLDAKSGSPQSQPSSLSTVTKSAAPPPAASTTVKPNAASVAPARGPQPIASPSPSSAACRPSQAKQEIACTLPDPQPFIMTLSFGKEKSFLDTQPNLVSALEKKVELLHTLSIPRVLDLLSSKDLRGILITQPDIADPEHEYLLAQLIEYVKAGGRVVLGGFFPAMIYFDKVEPFFERWGLEWSAGDYTSAEMTRNESHELMKIEENKELKLVSSGVWHGGMLQNRLPKTVNMKAHHLSGVEWEEAVYIGMQTGHHFQAVVVHTEVGDGRLGYIGDVGMVGEEHMKIVLGMFDLLL